MYSLRSTMNEINVASIILELCFLHYPYKCMRFCVCISNARRMGHKKRLLAGAHQLSRIAWGKFCCLNTWDTICQCTLVNTGHCGQK